MQFELPEDQVMLVETFRRFFADESSVARVRAAEQLGFDAALHRELGNMGALGLRTAEGGMGLFDAMLVCEEAGRALASTPLAETMVALRILDVLGGADETQRAASAGEVLLTLALHDAANGGTQIVSGAAAASHILYLDGENVVLLDRVPPLKGPATLASLAIDVLDLRTAAGTRRILGTGPAARALFLGGIEEWKLLTATILIGISRSALNLAVEYAKEREQFGRLIGSYQGIAHPLADRCCDVEGGGLLNWWVASQVASGAETAGATISMAYWWATYAAAETVKRCLQTFGGYGVSVEYDIQLFHRRANALGLLLGDPSREKLRAADRLWLGEQTALFDAGEVPIDFEIGPDALALAAETRKFLETVVTPEMRAKQHFSFDGYNAEVDHALGDAGLFLPGLPKEWGGRGADVFASSASHAVWSEFGLSGHAQSVAAFVAPTVAAFGSEELKRKVLPEIAAGRAPCALGYSEPSCGSDIFAARTRAVRDGDDWIINGQKMFTSGGHLAKYVLLIARTNPDVSKHRGITLFMVPVKEIAGFEVHRIDTFQDEPTNTTFYTDMRVPDLYRVGEVDGGVKVLSAALILEQQGGYGYGKRVLKAALDWAFEAKNDTSRPIDDAEVRRRLVQLQIHAHVADCIGSRSMWNVSLGIHAPRSAWGPMAKVFGSEAYQRDSADMLRLTAPDVLLRSGSGLGTIEQFHRQSAVATIYGGTSEVQRSQIAEQHLGLPRSRS